MKNHNQRKPLIVIIGLIALLVVAGCSNQQYADENYLTHAEMHEMMEAMLGDHFEEKHHTGMHVHMTKRGKLPKEYVHDPIMHEFMEEWMADHFDEEHHDELHKYLVSRGICNEEECPYANEGNSMHGMMNGDMMEQSGMMMGTEGFLAGEGFDASDLLHARSSTILEVSNGDVVDLSADIILKTINGKQYKMYGYNGQIPGPVFRAKKGTEITVNFHNNIDQNTTVHWHGLRHDHKDDGVPGVTQPPVVPGQSYTYTVRFPDEGIYWYHPHIREDSQQDSGLAGNIEVLPLTEDYYSPANVEEFLFLDDILIEDGIVPFGRDHGNFALMGRYGNVMLVNGETDYQLNVKQGEVVRFYITNVANVRPFNLSFGGATIKVVGSDLGKYEREEYANSIVIAPAERYIVEVFFEDSGEYAIQNINPHETYTLGRVIASNQEAAQDYSESFNSLRTNQDIISDIDAYRKYFDKPIDYEIDMTIDMNMMMNMGDGSGMPCHRMPNGQMMGDCDDEEHEEEEGIEWEDDMKMMNAQSDTSMLKWILKDKNTGKENMDIKLKANKGEIMKIRLFNDPDSMHPMQHPIHLHGQRFLVLSEDGVENDNLVWKDTVLVPTGSTVDILVDVTNPGEWMIHCHIAEHLEAGMMASLTVD